MGSFQINGSSCCTDSAESDANINITVSIIVEKQGRLLEIFIGVGDEVRGDDEIISILRDGGALEN